MLHIGLFGGTFNPVHVGHVELAKSVYKGLELDQFIFIPSKIPPHKNLGSTTPAERFKMVSIAIKSMDGNFAVSDYELKSKGISYTFKTLKHFRENYKNEILSFITGSDIFATIGSWNEWVKLFDLSNFIVVNRNEMPFKKMLDIIPTELKKYIIQPCEFNNEKNGKIILYNMEEIIISSTDIRDKIEQNKIKYYLTSEVYNYISDNNLYQGVK